MDCIGAARGARGGPRRVVVVELWLARSRRMGCFPRPLRPRPRLQRDHRHQWRRLDQGGAVLCLVHRRMHLDVHGPGVLGRRGVERVSRELRVRSARRGPRVFGIRARRGDGDVRANLHDHVHGDRLGLIRNWASERNVMERGVVSGCAVGWCAVRGGVCGRCLPASVPCGNTPSLVALAPPREAPWCTPTGAHTQRRSSVAPASLPPGMTRPGGSRRARYYSGPPHHYSKFLGATPASLRSQRVLPRAPRGAMGTLGASIRAASGPGGGRASVRPRVPGGARALRCPAAQVARMGAHPRSLTHP